MTSPSSPAIKTSKKTASALEIIVAHRLTDGVVVYLTPASSWSQSINEAAVADSPEQTQALLAIGQESVHACTVVDVEAIGIRLSHGGDSIIPLRLRESIRAIGPSTHHAFRRVHNIPHSPTE